jgi:hypothetical protein
LPRPQPTATTTQTLAPTAMSSPTHTQAPMGTPTQPPATASSFPPSPAADPASPTAADPEGWALLVQVAELAAGAEVLAFSRDDALLALGATNHEVQVWDTETWGQRWGTAHYDWVQAIAFRPDGERLSSVSFDHTARLWEVASGEQIAQLDYDHWVYGLDFSGVGGPSAPRATGADRRF